MGATAKSSAAELFSGADRHWERFTLVPFVFNRVSFLLLICFSLLENKGFGHSGIKCDVNKHGLRRM